MADIGKPKPSKRVTPKGTVPGRPAPRAGGSGSRPEATGRYTPPIPRSQKVSPPWVPVLMFTLLGVGALVIVINYLGVLPGSPDNWYLLGGLALITGGFITATQYH
jgi:hypothetical protein